MTKRIAVLISGNGSNLQALINACADEALDAEIVRVISNCDQAYGLVRANNANIDTLVIDHKGFTDRATFDAALHSALEECGAEIVCLAGFMRILTPEFVSKWEGKMINIHPSLLPAFKGLDTHQRAIDAGVKFAGCTVHFVSAEMDAGPIIIQAAVPIAQDDTAQSLAAHVLNEEHKIYRQALTWLVNDKLSIEGQIVTQKSATDSSAALCNPVIAS